MVPVIVISLASAEERRAFISKRLNELGVAFRFFKAVDGSQLTPQQIAEFDPYRYHGQNGRKLSTSEIGCALSHIEVVRMIQISGEEFTCVLEDDLEIDDEIVFFLQPATLRSLPKFDVLRLCNGIRNTPLCWFAGNQNGRQIVAPFLSGYSTSGMIYSFQGANKVERHSLPLRAPIDNMLFRDGRIPFLRTLEVRPRLVKERPIPSTVKKNYIPSSILARIRKKFFLLCRFFRTIRNFAGAWGYATLFKLRRKTTPAEI